MTLPPDATERREEKKMRKEVNQREYKAKIIKLDTAQFVWIWRAVLAIATVVIILQYLPSFTYLLNLMIDLFKLSDTSPEFKIILVCIAIYVNVLVFTMVVNVAYKLHSLLEDKLIEVSKKDETRRNRNRTD